MPLENVGRILSGTAGSAVEARTGGKYAAGDTVVQCSVLGEAVRFIFTDGVDAGEPTGLMMPGSGAIITVIAGGAVDEMDLVMVNTDGRFVANADPDPGMFWVGRAVRGSSAEADGDLLTIDFFEQAQAVVAA